jgi:gluconate kinase
MNPELLQSQFTDLEEPHAGKGVLTIELGRTPRELVKEIKQRLNPTCQD